MRKDPERVEKLDWTPGAKKQSRWSFIYQELEKGPSEEWLVWTLDALHLVERAQDAIRAYAKRRAWTVETSSDFYRLAVRRRT